MTFEITPSPHENRGVISRARLPTHRASCSELLVHHVQSFLCIMFRASCASCSGFCSSCQGLSCITFRAWVFRGCGLGERPASTTQPSSGDRDEGSPPVLPRRVRSMVQSFLCLCIMFRASCASFRASCGSRSGLLVHRGSELLVDRPPRPTLPHHSAQDVGVRGCEI